MLVLSFLHERSENNTRMLSSFGLKRFWCKGCCPLVLLWMERPSKQPFSQSVSQRGIYTMSAVTYCNHMLIIPSCTEIVPAHSICSFLSLFTGFSSFSHFPILMALTAPYLSLYTGFLPLFSKLLLIFFLITFPPNDLFHSAYWVHDALHRLWASLSLPRLCLFVILVLFCSSLLASPRGNDWINEHILYMKTHTNLKVGPSGGSTVDYDWDLGTK